VQNGTPLYVLQELGGWKSPEMVRRYAHLAAEHLAPFADRLLAVRAADAGPGAVDLEGAGSYGTNPSQAWKAKRLSRS